jgi:hypothetical protein
MAMLDGHDPQPWFELMQCNGISGGRKKNPEAIGAGPDRGKEHLARTQVSSDSCDLASLSDVDWNRDSPS